MTIRTTHDRESAPPPTLLLRVFRVAIRFVDGLFAHNAFEAASSIAFWFFLSLVPLLVFGGFILGSLARSKGVDYLVAPLIEVVPGQDAEKLVALELARLSGAQSAPVAPLSIAGFLWTSSSGLHNLMDVFEIAVKVQRRAWWKQRGLALAWVVIGLVAAAGMILALVELDQVIHDTDHPAAAPVTPRRRRIRIPMLLHTPWEKLFAVIAMIAVGTTLLAGFYRFAVEHPVGVKRRAWPGAVTAVAAWLLMSWGFGAYVSSLANYALYYGSLAAVAVLLVWLYFTSFILVLGAEVNAHLEGVR